MITSKIHNVHVHRDGKRDRLDILLKILHIAREPVLKTHLLYRANMNFTQLNRYLEFLTKAELIEHVEPQSMLHTTGKGLECLKLFETLDEEQ